MIFRVVSAGDLPVFLQEDGLGRSNKAGLRVVGRVQDLSRVLVGRGNDDKAVPGSLTSTPTDKSYTPGVEDSHVKDADSAESSACPLLFVVLQPGVHRVGEFSDDGDGPSCTRQMGLLAAVYDL